MPLGVSQPVSLTGVTLVDDNTMAYFNLEGTMSLARVSRIAIILSLVMSFLIAGCSGGNTTVTPTDNNNQGGTNPAKIYDLFPGVTMYGVDRTYRTSSFTDDPKEWDPVFDLISQARSSLDIAVMQINRQALVDALLAQSATAHIRIVTEKAYYDDPAFRPFYQQLLNPLRNNGNIEIVTDKDGEPRLMHSRFMIIDRAKVALGSYIWSTEGSERTTGDVLVINDARIADAFTSQFNQMFSERKFGVEKRDATQHSFSVAGGTAQVEVYFGPTDGLRDLLSAELDASEVVIGAVQQFSDVTFANYVFNWLSGNAGFSAPEDRLMYLTLNDIGSFGDADENAIYQALVGGMTGGGGGGGTGEDGYPAGFLVNTPPNATWAQVGMQMNHKYLYADHAATNNLPSLTVGSLNWTTQGFTLNDEVIVILRGQALTSKYHNFFWLQFPNFGNDVIARDFREDAQISMMYPFVTNMTDAAVPRDPALADLSCGLIFGKVSNFRREVTFQDDEGNFQRIPIDVQFGVQGLYYFGGNIAGYVYPTFDENELSNPDYNYIFVVPAGQLTVTCVVVDGNGEPIEGFEPLSQTFDVAPGGIRNINFQISQYSGDGGGGGTTG